MFTFLGEMFSQRVLFTSTEIIPHDLISLHGWVKGQYFGAGNKKPERGGEAADSERLLLGAMNELGFLAFRGEECDPGPVMSLDCSEFFVIKFY